ncbi:MAG: hypothetical protein U0270_07990 [Labilithrix sp.]
MPSGVPPDGVIVSEGPTRTVALAWRSAVSFTSMVSVTSPVVPAVNRPMPPLMLPPTGGFVITA